MDQATELGRVLVSKDKDPLAEATRRQRANVTIDGPVRDLRIIVEATDPSERLNRVEYLPP